MCVCVFFVLIQCNFASLYTEHKLHHPCVNLYTISFTNLLSFVNVLILLVVMSYLNLNILGFVWLCGLRSFFLWRSVKKSQINKT